MSSWLPVWTRPAISKCMLLLLAPLTVVSQSLSDTNLSGGIRRPAAYVNFFKSLLLLHFLLDSFETRYTYFLGQSPNFVLFRILKFGFSDFFMNCHQIFIEIAAAPTVSNGFL